MPRRFRRAALAAVAALAWLGASEGLAHPLPTAHEHAATPAVEAAASAAPVHLRIVGGLAGLNQFTRHEEPFWTRTLTVLSSGRATAEIVAFDRAGVRGQEMLRLVQLGSVPFGTVLLGLAAAQEPELYAPDLAGANPDMASMRRSAAAFRPYLDKLLRERHGAELLALYVYPSQDTFCTRPLTGLADLAGRRVRVGSATQSDFVLALGGIPVLTGFAEITGNMKNGSIDCAITGTMSGNTIGLHELTRYLHTMPLTWGLAAFVVNGATWNALPPELQALLRRELQTLERAIWDESDRESGEGIACNVGAAACRHGRKGRMVAVETSAADDARRRQILQEQVLPAWIRRCGERCADTWTRTLGPVTGIAVR